MASSTLNTGALGSITLSSTLNGGFAFSATSPIVTFGGKVGDTAALTSLFVDASGSIITHGNQSVSAGPMTYQGTVILNSATTFSNTGSTAITFQNSTLLMGVGDITGNFPVTITALPSGSIDVTGNINTTGAGANGAPVTLLASSNISVGSVTTTGATNFSGGNVQMTSSHGSITTGTINASGVGTGGGASILLQPTSEFTTGSLGNLPSGIVVLNGNLLADGASGGSIILSAGRTTAMSVATITSSLAGNNVTITAPAFSVGANEAITVLGNLTLNTTTAVLGDTVALGTLTIGLPGSSVTVLIHGDETLLTFTGSLATSSSVHFLSGGTYLLNGTPVPSSPLNQGQVSTLTSSQLIYAPQSLILNFDSVAIPIIPPTPPGFPNGTRESIINSFVIANSELFYMLPGADQFGVQHRLNKICFKDKDYCLSFFPWFQSWLPTNNVW
jgi:hypothetical protein